MSNESYEELIQLGAPRFPEGLGLYYAVRQWKDDRLFADNEVVRVSINQHVTPGRWKGWWWTHLPKAHWFMDDPTTRFITGQTLPLIERHPYQPDENVIAHPVEVTTRIVEMMGHLWDSIKEAETKRENLLLAVAEAKRWEGDHP